MFIVVVTACMSGVAHTYMAAEKIEKMCAARGIKIRVETQGALGVEDPLTEQEIQNADLALMIADIAVENEARFDSCHQIRVSTDVFLRDSARVMREIEHHSPMSTKMRIEIN